MEFLSVSLTSILDKIINFLGLVKTYTMYSNKYLVNKSYYNIGLLASLNCKTTENFYLECFIFYRRGCLSTELYNKCFNKDITNFDKHSILPYELSDVVSNNYVKYLFDMIKPGKFENNPQSNNSNNINIFSNIISPIFNIEDELRFGCFFSFFFEFQESIKMQDFIQLRRLNIDTNIVTKIYGDKDDFLECFFIENKLIAILLGKKYNNRLYFQVWKKADFNNVSFNRSISENKPIDLLIDSLFLFINKNINNYLKGLISSYEIDYFNQEINFTELESKKYFTIKNILDENSKKVHINIDDDYLNKTSNTFSLYSL
jgi:hypothetical protein